MMIPTSKRRSQLRKAKHEEERLAVGYEDHGKICSSVVCPCKLRDPWRNDGVDEADTYSCNYTSTDEHVCVLTRGLEAASKNAEQRAKPDTLLAAKLVGN